MSQTYTLEELRTRVWERGGWTMETSRHTAATLTRELSLSAMDLRDQMLRAGLTHLFVETAPTITTVDGTATYAVSGGYYQVLNVEIDDGTTASRRELKAFMEGERAHLRAITGTGLPQYFQAYGEGSIELLPTPAGVYSVIVRRISATPPLVADDDTFDGLNGLEEWIVCDVVRKLAAAEKDWPTVQAMDAMCARLGERVTTMARMRDRSSNKRVVDVRSRRRRYV